MFQRKALGRTLRQRRTHLPLGGGEQEIMDPFTAFAMAQAAVAGIKKPLLLVKISTAYTKNSAVFIKQRIQFT